MIGAYSTFILFSVVRHLTSKDGKGNQRIGKNTKLAGPNKLFYVFSFSKEDTVYIYHVIISIKHKGLKLLWEKGNGSKLPPALLKRISMVMQLIHSAKVVEDVNFPGANLHPLKGNLHGFWAVKISGNYRLIFRFEEAECQALDLDYIDYH